MKKLIKGLMLASAVTLFAAATANAQIVVRVRPVYHGPVVVRGVAPSPRHVWVEDEWAVNHGAYVRRPGHWEVHPGGVWIPGHWDRRPGGEVWIGGHWR
jgi:hypothetical protein